MTEKGYQEKYESALKFGVELCKQINSQGESIKSLERKLRNRENEIDALKFDKECLQRIIKDGELIFNYDSTDCDGCSTIGVRRFKTLEAYYECIKSESEWADGPFSYTLPEVDEQGNYILNEEYVGGSWGIN